MNNHTDRHLDRRRFLGMSVATVSAAALAACTNSAAPAAGPDRIMPTDPLVAEYEARRASTGKTVTQDLSAASFQATVAGKPVTTWGYNGALTAPILRAIAGDRLQVSLTNRLNDKTSIHWHGLALRNDQDGVPDLTQASVATGAGFSYDFRLPHPGTYWYHSHVEMQRERALYGALIIEDPAEKLVYDRDWVIVLDDWMDGITGTPNEVLNELSGGMSMPGMDHGSMSGSMEPSPSPSGSGGSTGMGMKHMLMGSRSDFLGGDAGDVGYPFHLFNSKAPDVLSEAQGDGGPGGGSSGGGIVTAHLAAAMPVPVSTGRPAADAQSAGPPLNTAMPVRPDAARMLAPPMARSPWPHITMTGPAGTPARFSAR